MARRFPWIRAASLAMVAACAAKGQAWTPARGEGAVSLTYQVIDNTGHRRTNGVLVPRGRSSDMSLYLEGEYAFTDHLSASIGLPYVFSKYTDANPPPAPIPLLPEDACRCWKSGLQDVSVSVRYRLTQGASRGFALTPSISVAVPSQNYNFRGEAALGRKLTETRIGIDAGKRLDSIMKGLSIQGGYSYAFVEKVMDISSNRSNARIEVDYLITAKLQVLGQALWQRTHGGLRFGSPSPATLVFPGEVNTPELLFQHDRLLRDNYWHAAGGLGYSFPKVDVFATYTVFAAGTDTHAGHALTVSFVVPFRLRGHH